MPQPTKQTASVFVSSDNVRSLELLPVPAVTPDFGLNLNTEVIWQALKEIWEDLIDPIIVSGFEVVDNTTEYNITAGRLFYIGYSLDLSSPVSFAKTALYNKQLRVRITDSQHTLENDPTRVIFQQAGYPTNYSGPNYRIYSFEIVIVDSGDPTPTPTQPPAGDEYSIIDIPFANFDGSGALTETLIAHAQVKLSQILEGDIGDIILVDPLSGVYFEVPSQQTLQATLQDLTDGINSVAEGDLVKAFTPEGTEEVSTEGDAPRVYTVSDSITYAHSANNLFTETGYWFTYGLAAMARGDISGSSKLFLATADGFGIDSRIKVLNPETFASEDTVFKATLDVALQTGSPNPCIWYPCDILISDGIAFVCFFNNESSTGYDLDHCVQAYDVTTWAKAPGWPAGGIHFGSGGFRIYDRFVDIDKDKFAFISSWQTITASTTPVVSIVSKTTGAILTSGCGDAFSTVTNVKDVKACSDGTNVFFIGDGGVSDDYVCSATVLDATVGIGGAFPVASTGESDIDCVSTNGEIIVCGHNAPSSGDILLSFFTKDTFVKVHFSQPSSPVYKSLIQLLFDGRNFWGLGAWEMGLYSYDGALFKLDLNGYCGTDAYMSVDSLVKPFLDGDATQFVFNGKHIFVGYSRTSNLVLCRLPRSRER